MPPGAANTPWDTADREKQGGWLEGAVGTQLPKNCALDVSRSPLPFPESLPNLQLRQAYPHCSHSPYSPPGSPLFLIPLSLFPLAHIFPPLPHGNTKCTPTASFVVLVGLIVLMEKTSPIGCQCHSKSMPMDAKGLAIVGLKKAPHVQQYQKCPIALGSQQWSEHTDPSKVQKIPRIQTLPCTAAKELQTWGMVVLISQHGVCNEKRHLATRAQ